MAKQTSEANAVQQLATDLRPNVPLRSVGLVRPSAMTPVSSMFYPAANIAGEAWRRADYGTGAWTLCGITHTTSTMGIMQGFFDLRMAPVMEWDAVICTSRAVQAAVLTQNELIDAHIRAHFKTQPPPRPMFPVIPLGVHCDDYARDEAARADLRARLNAGPDDVVFATIARLTPHEKFDPLPIYLAMQQAQSALPKGVKLHVVFCGLFRQDYARKVFEDGAARLMPDVGFLLLDGSKAEDRRATLSAADVFLFMIDNIQETFGLAPLEGMAAGLPLLVSDWDGLKDTVTPDVGIRVKSRMLGPRHHANESLRLQGGIDSYVQYCAAVSAMTEIDMGEMVAAILTLARDPDLRRRMGQAALARVRQHYDWAAVIPQMQALWGEQQARRDANLARAWRIPGQALPIAPSPSLLFAAYPTEVASFPETRFVATDLTGRAGLTELLEIRNYQALNRVFATSQHIAAVFDGITGAGAKGADLAALVTATGLREMFVERILMWLLKYDLIRRM